MAADRVTPPRKTLGLRFLRLDPVCPPWQCASLDRARKSFSFSRDLSNGAVRTRLGRKTERSRRDVRAVWLGYAAPHFSSRRNNYALGRSSAPGMATRPKARCFVAADPGRCGHRVLVRAGDGGRRCCGMVLFTRALVESRWFPGHEVPLRTLGFFMAVMLVGGLGFHALLEAKGDGWSLWR